jgi:hypothetical protein
MEGIGAAFVLGGMNVKVKKINNTATSGLMCLLANLISKHPDFST